MPVDANMTLANMEEVSNRFGLIDFAKHAKVAKEYIDLLNIRTPSPSQPVRLLSGGNQQKIIIGKWLFRKSRVLIFDEPTRGIDVGAKFAIYQIGGRTGRQGDRGHPDQLGAARDPRHDRSHRRVSSRPHRRMCWRPPRQTQEEIMHYASGYGRPSSRD